tara:strand:+ start:4284 stop:5147 length:864 start_codon:yes stop_codon:yes gene_type:complete
MATFEKRVNEQGNFSYRAKIRIKGHPTQSATFKRLTDAKAWARKIELEMQEGRFKLSQKQKKTLSELIDRYKQHLKIENPRRIRDAGYILDWWSKELGDFYLSSLTDTMIAEKLEKLRMTDLPTRDGKYSKATVNRYKSALQTALSMAVHPWQWLESNPASLIKNLKEPEGRVRFLSQDELKKLLEACRVSENPYLYSIVVIALSSGARKEEIRTIKWKNVLLDEHKIILPKTKNKKHRAIYLSHQAFKEILKRHEQKDIGDVYIFPSSDNPNCTPSAQVGQMMVYC